MVHLKRAPLPPLPTHVVAQQEQIQDGNALTWNIRRPTQGPVGLALKNHFVAMVGEYVGTTMFLLMALGGTNVANTPATSVTGVTTAGQDGSPASSVNTSSLLYISFCFGTSLAVNAWIFFRVSGGLFNPAVSLGMWLVGALTPLRAALLVVAQVLGGITGAALIQVLTPGTLNVRTTLVTGLSVSRGLFIEMFMTSMLMITILLLAAEKHKATYLAPIGIGMALFISEMTSVYWTGGSLNPARSFGPCVVLRTFNSYHWIYWLGPALGAAVAAGFYKFIKYLEYETVLGPEDATGSNTPVRGTGGASGGAPTMTGGNVAAGKMYEEKAASSGPTMAVQGAGLGDLLTQGAPSNVYDATNHDDHYYNARFDRIEDVLSQLLAHNHNSMQPVQSNSTAVAEDTGARASMATLTDNHNHKSLIHPAGYDNSPDLELGRKL